jgi:hypothetical protein
VLQECYKSVTRVLQECADLPDLAVCSRDVSLQSGQAELDVLDQNHVQARGEVPTVLCSVMQC